jgi:hypothetical protein
VFLFFEFTTCINEILIMKYFLGTLYLLSQTFNELDNLEIATGSDEETEQQSPPPIPPRTSSFVPRTSPPESEPRQPIPLSDSSESTSSDASDIREDTSSDSEDTTEDDKINIHCISKDFDANSSLPPIPNGTLDLTSPDKQQKFSSDEEKYVLFQNSYLQIFSY